MDKKLRLDSSSLTVKESKTVPDEAVSTTYHLAQCLRRRGLAYDFSFQSHEAYVEKLLRHLSLEPPPSFQSASLTQIIRANREVFMFMAQTKPLDSLLAQALSDYNTAFHLLPLPEQNRDESLFSSYRKRPLDNDLSRSTGGKGRGKNRNKGKSSGGASMAPQGYPGCVGRDAKNRSICFDRNIKGCKL